MPKRTRIIILSVIFIILGIGFSTTLIPAFYRPLFISGPILFFAGVIILIRNLSLSWGRKIFSPIFITLCGILFTYFGYNHFVKVTETDHTLGPVALIIFFVIPGLFLILFGIGLYLWEKRKRVDQTISGK